MAWRQIMFAVSSPGGVGPLVMSKVAQLAGGLDAEVDLFHCIFDSGVNRPGRFGTRGAQEDIHEFVDRRREQLERNAQQLRARGVPVRTSVRWDYPTHEAIVRQVLRRKPSLLVAQATRKGRVARLVLTRTDYKLIETCPCPLLLIKNDRPYSDAVIIAAVDPGQSHEKPATLDDDILDEASAVRAALRGKLQVFHAGAPLEEAVRANRDLRNVPDAVSDEVYAAYRNRIEAQVFSLARRHRIPEEFVQVLEGDAAELLPGIAQRESAGIVVLGATSRSRLGRAVIGHTAERALDALDCDVLVVKPPGFRTPVRRESTHHIARSAAHRTRYIL